MYTMDRVRIVSPYALYATVICSAPGGYEVIIDGQKSSTFILEDEIDA